MTGFGYFNTRQEQSPFGRSIILHFHYITFWRKNQTVPAYRYVKILAEIGFWARTGNRHGFVLNSFAVA